MNAIYKCNYDWTITPITLINGNISAYECFKIKWVHRKKVILKERVISYQKYFHDIYLIT